MSLPLTSLWRLTQRHSIRLPTLRLINNLAKHGPAVLAIVINPIVVRIASSRWQSHPIITAVRTTLIGGSRSMICRRSVLKWANEEAKDHQRHLTSPPSFGNVMG